MCGLFSKPNYTSPKVDPAPTPATSQELDKSGSVKKKQDKRLGFDSTLLTNSGVLESTASSGKRTSLG